MTVVEMKEARINVLENPKELVHALAERFCALAKEAIAQRNSFTCALSGGSTPQPLYELLASPEYKGRVNWDKVLVFLGDERCVPPDHPDSNFGMIKRLMLAKISIPDHNIFAPEGQDKDPKASAQDYEEKVRRAFGHSEEVPRFDLNLLGLGPDGHTASLFPGTEALTVADKLVVANFVPKFNSWRLTFTYKLINHSRHIDFMVDGQEKASIVKEIFETKDKFPCQNVRPQGGTLEWYMDRAAASSLREVK